MIELIEEELKLVRTVLLVRNKKVLSRAPLAVPVSCPEELEDAHARLLAAESEILAEAAKQFPEAPQE